MSWVSKDSGKLDGDYLNRIFIALKENKRLRSRYSSLLPNLNQLLQSHEALFDQSITTCHKVDFYKLRSASSNFDKLRSLVSIDYTRDRLEALHNFV